MGGKWEPQMPGLWRREYATGVFGDIAAAAADGMQVYEVSVVYDKPGHFEHILETITGDSLSDVKRLADRAFQKWFLKRELKARADHGMLYPRAPMGLMFDTDTDDMLLMDLNVPPEMKAELKAYMGTLKRAAPPRTAEIARERIER